MYGAAILNLLGKDTDMQLGHRDKHCSKMLAVTYFVRKFTAFKLYLIFR